MTKKKQVKKSKRAIAAPTYRKSPKKKPKKPPKKRRKPSKRSKIRRPQFHGESTAAIQARKKSPYFKGVELDEDELESLAEHWGVSADDVEDLFEQVHESFEVSDLNDVSEYLEALRDFLDELGYDVDISDLWDMYYGYTPGGEG